MGRAKVPMKLIESAKSRRVTFLKRSQGLKKKAYEIATLCDAKVCMISLPPPEMEQMKPNIWPENPDEVIEIINRYRGMGERDRKKGKLIQKLSKPCLSWDVNLDGLSMDKIQGILNNLDMKLENVKRRKIELLQGSSGCSTSAEIAPTRQSPDHMQGLTGPFTCLNDFNIGPMDSPVISPQPISWRPLEDQVPVPEFDPMNVYAMVKMDSLAGPSSNDSTGLDLPHSPPLQQIQSDSAGSSPLRFPIPLATDSLYQMPLQQAQSESTDSSPLRHPIPLATDSLYQMPLQEVKSESGGSSSPLLYPISLDTESLQQILMFFLEADCRNRDQDLQLRDNSSIETSSNEQMVASSIGPYGSEYLDSLVQAHYFDHDLVEMAPGPYLTSQGGPYGFLQ